MKLLPFFLFLSTALFATLTEPFTFELQIGYREDHLNWRMKLKDNTNLDTYHEKYSHLRYWQNNLVLKSINRDIYIVAEVGYGAFGKGDMDQNSIRNTSINTESTYTFGTDAETAHGKGIFGYFVDLTPMRYYRVAVIPLAGYSIYYTKIQRKNPSPNPFNGAFPTTGTPVEVFSSLGRDLKLRWYGPFVGGIIYIYPGDNFVFEAGYHYHWLQMRQTVYNEFLTQLFDSSGALINVTNQIQKGKIRVGSNLCHEGILKATYLLSRHLRLSALGKLFYFSSRVKAVQLDQQIQAIAPAGPTSEGVIERNYKGRYVFWFALFELDLLL